MTQPTDSVPLRSSPPQEGTTTSVRVSSADLTPLQIAEAQAGRLGRWICEDSLGFVEFSSQEAADAVLVDALWSLTFVEVTPAQADAAARYVKRQPVTEGSLQRRARMTAEVLRRLPARLSERPAQEGTTPHPEDTCQQCGGPNVVWFAPNELWNRVMGSPDGIVCPRCFVLAAEKVGIHEVWSLRPGRPAQGADEPGTTPSPSGAFRDLASENAAVAEYVASLADEDARVTPDPRFCGGCGFTFDAARSPSCPLCAPAVPQGAAAPKLLRTQAEIDAAFAAAGIPKHDLVAAPEGDRARYGECSGCLRARTAEDFDASLTHCLRCIADADAQHTANCAAAPVTEPRQMSFAELVEYGRSHGANIVNGMPWSFTFNGVPITHENDECYLVITRAGTQRFTPRDTLLVGPEGQLVVLVAEPAPAIPQGAEKPGTEKRFREALSRIDEVLYDVDSPSLLDTVELARREPENIARCYLAIRDIVVEVFRDEVNALATPTSADTCPSCGRGICAGCPPAVPQGAAAEPTREEDEALLFLRRHCASGSRDADNAVATISACLAALRQSLASAEARATSLTDAATAFLASWDGMTPNATADALVVAAIRAALSPSPSEPAR